MRVPGARHRNGSTLVGKTVGCLVGDRFPGVLLFHIRRETAALLDVKDPIRNQYNLEVSSPGLDRPLFRIEHYQEFTGYVVKITTFAPVDGRRKFSGPILGAEEQVVTIDQDGSEVTLDLSNIVKAKLVPDYEKILAGHKTK